MTTTDLIHNMLPADSHIRQHRLPLFLMSEINLTSQTDSKEDYHGSYSIQRDTCLLKWFEMTPAYVREGQLFEAWR